MAQCDVLEFLIEDVSLVELFLVRYQIIGTFMLSKT
jgi:hypothetical protein